jgi:hypothetical protein
VEGRQVQHPYLAWYPNAVGVFHSLLWPCRLLIWKR